MSVLQHLLSLPSPEQSMCIPSQYCFELLEEQVLCQHSNNHEPERFLVLLESEYLHVILIFNHTFRTQCHIIPFNNIRNMNGNWSIRTNSVLLHQSNQFTLCQITYYSIHSLVSTRSWCQTFFTYAFIDFQNFSLFQQRHKLCTFLNSKVIEE